MGKNRGDAVTEAKQTPPRTGEHALAGTKPHA